MRRHVHVITPGDHYSPSTGSAVPTVVHGLATGRRPGTPCDWVAVARGTYPDRYDSARAVEYDPMPGAKWDRYADFALARVGAVRARARRVFRPTVAQQSEWEPSYVFAHNAPTLIPLVDAKRHRPVLYAHNDILRSFSLREAERTLRSSAAIICVSEALAERTRRRLPRTLHDRIAVVHNGVDTDFFHPASAGEGREVLEVLEVLLVGRMVPAKGADVLLSAIESLNRADLHVTIVGSAGFSAQDALTPFERTIRRSAATLGNRLTVRPFMPRSQIAEAMRGADIMVVPSRWPDPFPLTVLEAMASGAAVVASRIGGIPEAAGDAAVLVPADDVAALAAALESLADDRAALLAYKQRARARAEAHDWAHARRRLDAVLAAKG